MDRTGWAKRDNGVLRPTSRHLQHGRDASQPQTNEPAPTSLEYRLRAEPQALFIDPTLTVQVTPPPGWGPVAVPGMQVSEGTATVSAVLDGPLDVGIRFEKRQ